MIEITIRLPDDIYDRLRRDAEASHTAPEQVAVIALTTVFSPESEAMPPDVASTVARLRAWRAEQPRETVRPPLLLRESDQQALDRELDDLFESIQSRSQAISYEQVRQDVRDALSQKTNAVI